MAINLQKLTKNLPFDLSDVTKIEYGYYYIGRVRWKYAIFFKDEEKVEIAPFNENTQDVTDFALQYKLCKVTYSIPDKISVKEYTKDCMVFERSNTGCFEMVYPVPGRWQVINKNSAELQMALVFVPLLIFLPIYSYIVFYKSSLQTIMTAGSILFFIIGIPLLIVLALLVSGYIRRKKEYQTFKVEQMFSRDYPYIQLNEQYFIYQQYGKQNKLVWADIVALDNVPGRTILHTRDNQEYPIPTYQILSDFISNAPLVDKIIEYAKLMKDRERENYWMKPEEVS